MCGWSSSGILVPLADCYDPFTALPRRPIPFPFTPPSFPRVSLSVTRLSVLPLRLSLFPLSHVRLFVCVCVSKWLCF